MNMRLRRRIAFGTTITAMSVLISTLISPAASSAAPSYFPFGHLDAITVGANHTVRMQGWAIDNDNPRQPLFIAIYHGVHIVGWFRSGVSRPDVARAMHAGPRQGFDITVSQLPGKHHMCAWAINIGPGANNLIGCKTVVVP